jgi:hypothetical protein
MSMLLMCDEVRQFVKQCDEKSVSVSVAIHRERMPVSTRSEITVNRGSRGSNDKMVRVLAQQITCHGKGSRRNKSRQTCLQISAVLHALQKSLLPLFQLQIKTNPESDHPISDKNYIGSFSEKGYRN